MNRLISRRRRRKLLLCLLGMAVCVSGAIFCILRLMPMYADYSYRTGLETLHLPEIEKPCRAHIRILYSGSIPSDIIATAGGRSYGNPYAMTVDEDSKLIDILWDIQAPGSDYCIVLRPEDNSFLDYSIEIMPSVLELDIEASAVSIKGPDSELDIRAQYVYNDDPIYGYLVAKGNRFSKTSRTFVIENGGDIKFVIYDMFDVDLSRAESFTLHLYQDETGEDGHVQHVRLYSMKITDIAIDRVSMKEQTGNMLDEDSVPVLTTEIIDIFNDYLKNKNLSFRAEPSLVSSEIEFSVREYGLTSGTVLSSGEMSAVENYILSCFTKISSKNGYEMPDEDIRSLKEQIREVFMSWGLYET